MGSLFLKDNDQYPLVAKTQNKCMNINKRIFFKWILGFPFLLFPVISKKNQKKHFCSISLFRSNKDQYPRLVNLKNYNAQFWNRFRSKKIEFLKKGYLVDCQMKRIKENIFLVIYYWDSKKSFDDFYKINQGEKFKKELYNNGFETICDKFYS